MPVRKSAHCWLMSLGLYLGSLSTALQPKGERTHSSPKGQEFDGILDQRC